MKKRLLYYIGPIYGGIIFALGLGLSGMLIPRKIIGFLDIFGAWDPTLIFVMLGAIVVHMSLYRFIIKARSPLFDIKFYWPSKTDIDAKLIVGSLIFGIGWAVSGLCPAPGLVSLMTFDAYVIVFVGSMLSGIIVAKLLFVKKSSQ